MMNIIHPSRKVLQALTITEKKERKIRVSPHRKREITPLLSTIPLSDSDNGKQSPLLNYVLHTLIITLLILI